VFCCRGCRPKNSSPCLINDPDGEVDAHEEWSRGQCPLDVVVAGWVYWADVEVVSVRLSVSDLHRASGGFASVCVHVGKRQLSVAHGPSGAGSHRPRRVLSWGVIDFDGDVGVLLEDASPGVAAWRYPHILHGSSAESSAFSAAGGVGNCGSRDERNERQ